MLGALTGLRIGAGDTLAAKDHPIVIKHIDYPEAAIAFAVEPKARGDEDKLGASVARAGWVDPLFVPAPSAVAGAFGRIGRSALVGLGDTLLKTAVAYVLSVVLGVALGVAIGSVRALREVLSPFVIAVYGMPKILVLPWIVLILGFGTAPAIVYGTIHGLFPILVLVLIAWIVNDYLNQRRRLLELGVSGVVRRSGGSATER